MKRKALCVLVSALLLAALGLFVCSEAKYKVLNGARLEDCTLTIQYDDPHIYRRRPLTLRDYYENARKGYVDDHIYYTTVSGTKVKENPKFLALLKMLDRNGLPPVQDITNYWWDLRPHIYYTLTDQDGEMLFDVSIGWGIYLNGERITDGELLRSSTLFRSGVKPYLTELHY